MSRRDTISPTANFLTSIVTQNATDSDKAGMVEVFDQERNHGLDAPSALYVDGAYVSSEALKDARDEGRELRGPAPASPNRGKVFTVEAFDVHVEERYATCPGAQRSSNCSRLEEQATGKVSYRIEWSNSVCTDLPATHSMRQPRPDSPNVRGRRAAHAPSGTSAGNANRRVQTGNAPA
jgi:hypothetical protein